MKFRRCVMVAAVAAVFGCTVGQPAAAPPASPAVAPAAAGALEGDARFPAEVAADGAVIPTGIGSYRLQQAASDVPLAGATVTARDPASRAPLPFPAARTDAQGRFRLEGPAPGENHLIEVSLQAADGERGVRLLALGRVGAPIAVSWRSTAVVAELLAAPGGRDLKQVDLAPLAAAEAAREAAYLALAPAERKAFFGALLTVDARPEGAALPLPSVAPLPVVSALPSLLPTIQPSGGGTNILGSAPGIVSSALPASPVSTVASILPSLLPSPEPSAPTPAPSASSGLVETVVDTVDETVDNLPLPSPSVKLPLL